MTVICKLKELCEEQGLSQLAVAQATKISPTTIGKLYRNQFERIDNHTIEVLCQYFQIPIEKLLEVAYK
jgi:putative transcriptional regulator